MAWRGRTAAGVPAIGHPSRFSKAPLFAAFPRCFELVTIRLSGATQLSHAIEHARARSTTRAARGWRSCQRAWHMDCSAEGHEPSSQRRCNRHHVRRRVHREHGTSLGRCGCSGAFVRDHRGVCRRYRLDANLAARCARQATRPTRPALKSRRRESTSMCAQRNGARRVEPFSRRCRVFERCVRA